MQLEELQRQWQQLDQKLDQSIKLETELLRRSVVFPARNRIRRLTIWFTLDIVFCLMALLLAGGLLANHWPLWNLVLPSIVVMFAAVLLLIDTVRQLVMVWELKWSAPVADIQRQLERLRSAKILQFKWIILLSPLVGFCLLLVGLQSLFDWLTGFRVRILDKVAPAWVIGNYVFGVLFVPLGFLTARYLAGRLAGSGLWQRVLDDISGRSLQTARRELQSWTELVQPGQQEHYSPMNGLQ